MFYCDTCGEKKEWPKGLVKSYGRCEVCGTTAVCSDIPSRELPKPKQEITGLYAGQYFKAFLVDETPEVVPTEWTLGREAYSKSEAVSMAVEMSTISKILNKL
jgi:hypothetical protein